MENYQTATVVVGIISFAFWMGVGFFFLPAFALAFIAFGFMWTCFADTKHAQSLGGLYIVVGILFNWLYLIPGIMAIRWKPQLQQPVVYTPMPQPRPATTEEKIELLEEEVKRLQNQVNKEKEDLR